MNIFLKYVLRKLDSMSTLLLRKKNFFLRSRRYRKTGFKVSGFQKNKFLNSMLLRIFWVACYSGKQVLGSRKINFWVACYSELSDPVWKVGEWHIIRIRKPCVFKRFSFTQRFAYNNFTQALRKIIYALRKTFYARFFYATCVYV